MNTFLVVILVVVFGFVIGNIMLLKHASKFKVPKNLVQDPIEKARQSLKEQQRTGKDNKKTNL